MVIVLKKKPRYIYTYYLIYTATFIETFTNPYLSFDHKYNHTNITNIYNFLYTHAHLIYLYTYSKNYQKLTFQTKK